MDIFQTTTFSKQVKRIHKNEKKELNSAVKKIIEEPNIGEAKKGDLSGVRVYKFKMVKQLTLLAYEYREKESQIILLSFGAHENFYRDLKNTKH